MLPKNPKMIMIGLVAMLALAGSAMAADDGMTNQTPEKAQHFAPFQRAGDDVSGKYVDLLVADSAIENYSLRDRVVFTSIELPGPMTKDVTHGALFAARGDDYRLAAFDARNGGLFIQAENATTIVLRVADDISLAYHAAEKGWSPEGVLLTLGNVTAKLVVRGNSSVSVDGQLIRVTLGQGATMAFHVNGHPWELLKEKWAMRKIHDKGKAKGMGKGKDKGMAKARGKGKKN